MGWTARRRAPTGHWPPIQFSSSRPRAWLPGSRVEDYGGQVSFNMALFVAIFLGCLLILIAWTYWRRVGAGREDETGGRKGFVRWAALGAGVPVGLWLLFNLGLLGPPVWPAVAPISAGWNTWYRSFDTFAFSSTLIIVSFWAGVTFPWLLVRVGRVAENRRDFAVLCLTWSLLLLPVTASLLYFGGGAMLGLALFTGSLPLVHMALNLAPERAVTPPSYARAVAKLNFGKYAEAELDILQELEKHEEDFDGWMMLAELYATQYGDLPSAHETIRDLCAQPTTTPVQASIAWHRLADWQLKYGRDPQAARDALEAICRRLPGTHLDRMARQRLRQLPATRQELEARDAGKPIHLPACPDVMEPPVPAMSRETALAEAARATEVLQSNPDDVEARESFARLLAEQLGHADTAIDQLGQLLAMPQQPAEQRSRWLLTMAGWHARHRSDPAAARLVYEEVMRDFPNSPDAVVAQRRLNMLTLQARLRRRSTDL